MRVNIHYSISSEENHRHRVRYFRKYNFQQNYRIPREEINYELRCVMSKE